MIRPEPEIIFTFVQTKRSMKVLYTALLALLLFPSCRRQSGDIDSFLHNAESLMNEHPEDALSIIRHIDRRKIYSSASEARYALLYSQALDKNYVDVTSDSLTAVAVNYYDRHGTKHERAMAHYYQGRVFSNAGNFDAAIRSYSLAEDAASGTDDYYLLGLINNAVGNLHFEQYDLDEALQRDQQAASFFHRAQSPYNEALAYIGVGTVYSLKGDNEQMEIVYNKAIEIYKELNATDKILPLYEDIIMEKVFDFLSKHKDVAFATVEQNKPKIRVFQIMKQEGHTLYFATSPHKEVYRQLQENPNIELLAMDGNISVRVTGRAMFDVPDGLAREIYADNPVLPRLYKRYTDLVYFRLPVTRLDYYDLTPTPPTFEHYEYESED